MYKIRIEVRRRKEVRGTYRNVFCMSSFTINNIFYISLIAIAYTPEYIISFLL